MTSPAKVPNWSVSMPGGAITRAPNSAAKAGATWRSLPCMVPIAITLPA
ncbi:hypothetical protein [Mycobacterium paragordonae]